MVSLSVEEAVRMMESYFEENRELIEHTREVIRFARRIVDGEKIDDPEMRRRALLAAVFHDIGIPEAIRRHGSAKAAFQEEEGARVVVELLERAGVDRAITDRLRYVVGHHHTADAIDALDFQILWEADYLVNTGPAAADLALEELQRVVAENFRTETGRRIFESLNATEI